jgi:hypothetical protein
MRLLCWAPVVAVALTGCDSSSESSNEQCLEVRISGVQPTQTQYIVTTEFIAASGSLALIDEQSAGLLLSGWHSVTCTSPGLADENYRFVTWYDDGPTDPGTTYCGTYDAALCHPQPGQPWGEVTALFPARGYTTVTVPVHTAQ